MKMVRYNPRTGERVEFNDGKPTATPTCACPCCQFITLVELGGYEICPVCFWEDDGQNDADADEIRGGPNGDLSLAQARKNFVHIGACEESMVKNVRPPYPDEFPKPLSV
jgi:hypothetical protein